MKKAALFIVLALASCSDEPAQHSKGLVDTKTAPAKVYTQDGGRVIQLVVYRAKSSHELQTRIGKKSGEARWIVRDNKCTIEFHGNDYETAGHELRHCLDGAFHKE